MEGVKEFAGKFFISSTIYYNFRPFAGIGCLSFINTKVAFWTLNAKAFCHNGGICLIRKPNFVRSMCGTIRFCHGLLVANGRKRGR